MNWIVNFLVSIPVILLALYFIPVLGVILIICRSFIKPTSKKMVLGLLILGFGLLLLIPQVVNSICLNLNVKVEIPYFEELISSTFYKVNIINYSKLLISIGIVYLILSFIMTKWFNKTESMIKSYISNIEKRDREIAKENDKEMRIKREKAKNTSYVRCPYCGADNIISGKTGKCSYCRRTLENKNYKG